MARWVALNNFGHYLLPDSMIQGVDFSSPNVKSKLDLIAP